MKTSVEKYSYQKHRSRANAEREVEEKFNRDWERVSTQMGKDLPRYYSTCEIVDHRTGAQYNGENDSLENFFLTLGNAFELSEAGKAKINFTDKKLFAEEVLDLLDYLVKSCPIICQVLKCCTQGHIAPCSTAMLYSLGMEHTASNLSHVIRITVSESSVSVLHVREEIAAWGKFKWELECILAIESPDQFQSVEFMITHLDISKVALKSVIEKALLPYCCLSMQTLLTVVDCLSMGFSKIPKEILIYTQLTVLFLDANSLQSLPPEIIALTHLEQITLNMNKLTGFLPLCSIHALKKISLGSNKISNIHDEIGHLVNLEEFHIAKNFIEELPVTMKELINLRELSLSGNCIKTVQPLTVLKDIGSLQKLSLFGNPVSQHVSTDSVVVGKEGIAAYLSTLLNDVALIEALCG